MVDQPVRMYIRREGRHDAEIAAIKAGLHGPVSTQTEIPSSQTEKIALVKASATYISPRWSSMHTAFGHSRPSPWCRMVKGPPVIGTLLRGT